MTDAKRQRAAVGAGALRHLAQWLAGGSVRAGATVLRRAPCASCSLELIARIVAGCAIGMSDKVPPFVPVPPNYDLSDSWRRNGGDAHEYHKSVDTRAEGTTDNFPRVTVRSDLHLCRECQATPVHQVQAAR